MPDKCNRAGSEAAHTPFQQTRMLHDTLWIMQAAGMSGAVTAGRCLLCLGPQLLTAAALTSAATKAQATRCCVGEAAAFATARRPAATSASQKVGGIDEEGVTSALSRAAATRANCHSVTGGTGHRLVVGIDQGAAAATC
jgi:hypothetical protein